MEEGFEPYNCQLHEVHWFLGRNQFEEVGNPIYGFYYHLEFKRDSFGRILGWSQYIDSQRITYQDYSTARVTHSRIGKGSTLWTIDYYTYQFEENRIQSLKKVPGEDYKQQIEMQHFSYDEEERINEIYFYRLAENQMDTIAQRLERFSYDDEDRLMEADIFGLSEDQSWVRRQRHLYDYGDQNFKNPFAKALAPGFLRWGLSSSYPCTITKEIFTDSTTQISMVDNHCDWFTPNRNGYPSNSAYIIYSNCN